MTSAASAAGARAAAIDRLGRLGHVGGEQRRAVAAGERRLAGEHLVGEAAERVDVGAMIDVRIGRGLLGRHVGRRAERDAERGEPRVRRAVADAEQRLGDPEVGRPAPRRRRAARCRA